MPKSTGRSEEEERRKWMSASGPPRTGSQVEAEGVKGGEGGGKEGGAGGNRCHAGGVLAPASPSAQWLGRLCSMDYAVGLHQAHEAVRPHLVCDMPTLLHTTVHTLCRHPVAAVG